MLILAELPILGKGIWKAMVIDNLVTFIQVERNEGKEHGLKFLKYNKKWKNFHWSLEQIIET